MERENITQVSVKRPRTPLDFGQTGEDGGSNNVMGGDKIVERILK
jgi:hypothetical protein